MENQLFARIRDLKAQDVYGLPPQLAHGEYENLVLVRENLAQAETVPRIGFSCYQDALSLEIFDLTIMEHKATLQKNLLSLFFFYRRR